MEVRLLRRRDHRHQDARNGCYELARKIREVESIERRKRTPIIACSANALRDDAEKCLAAGMDDYLAKPVHLDELKDKLRRWVPLPLDRGQPASAVDCDVPSTVDRSVIGKVSGGAAERERLLLEKFRRMNNEDVLILQKAIAEKNSAEVMRAAHGMNGASSMIGALRLRDACARVEQAARLNDLAAVKVHMSAVLEEVQLLERYIDSLSG